ncbi:hypothetical protein A3K80_04345 [Candidatus Bathyarchaeota archaeon RBG_13_38_9]|nr:MAG: hypothetical protein A3K80_04345 [Candidatus Bathyarchaeota archaeon RBG_13_38_9]
MVASVRKRLPKFSWQSIIFLVSLGLWAATGMLVYLENFTPEMKVLNITNSQRQTSRPYLWNKNIVVVGHITEIYGPVQALINYFKKNVNEFTSILHPFSYTSISESENNLFIRGKSEKIIRQKNIKSSEVISFLQHFLLTFCFLLRRNKRKIDIYVGADNLSAFVGILLKKIHITDEVVFYIIDYTPKRFENRYMNFLYHSLTIFCVRNCDYTWNISKRIADLLAGKTSVSKQRNFVVPVGIELEKIQHAPENEVRRNLLIFAGHLTRQKGIELVIEAMKDIVKEVPEAKLEIVGVGPYEHELKAITERNFLNDHIKFMGYLDHNLLLRYLPTCGIALATYPADPDSITYYADPTKPKEYLACGLPVVITNVSWIANIINSVPMGISINYNTVELKNAIVKLMKDDVFYEACRRNALKFIFDLSWDTIYNNAFSRIVELRNS